MLRDEFTRASLTGKQAMSLAPDARNRIVRECLAALDKHKDAGDKVSEHAISLIMQPLFALSGYKLKTEALEKDGIRFDLVAENIVGGDDRILIDYKFSRDNKPRTLIPGALINHVSTLAPQDPTRVLMVTPAGFDWNVSSKVLRSAGPRLELWSFEDVRSRLEKLLTSDLTELDIVVKFVLDMIEKVALAIGRAEASLRQVEWRDLERLMSLVLTELGYAVHLTQSAQDGGKDLIVADFTIDGLAVYNVEIKHWSKQRPGVKEVQRILDVSVREGRDGALLLATNGVGQAAVNARSELRTEYLRFGSETKMVTTCRTYAQKKDGLWTGHRPFKTYMYEDTE